MRQFSAHWLIPGQYHSFGELESSSTASLRLRAAVSIGALQSSGWVVSFGESCGATPSILAVGKIGANDIQTRSREWLEQIHFCKRSGSRILIDYSDHHLGFRSTMSEFYQNAVPLADVLVTPSLRMAELLGSCCTHEILTIEEPVEFAARAPCLRIKTCQRPRLLWFGHSSNISYLIDWLDSLVDSDTRDFDLLVLSNGEGLEIFSAHVFHPKLSFRAHLATWSLANMQHAAEECDLCVIPTDPSDAKKSGASANRLVTALALGLPTAAHRLPSYAPLSKFFIDLDCAEVGGLFKDPGAFAPMVSSFQLEALPFFLAEVVGAAWREAFSLCVSRE